MVGWVLVPAITALKEKTTKEEKKELPYNQPIKIFNIPLPAK